MTPETDDDPNEAPGWDAITAAAAARGLGRPLHYGTANLPDQDGLYAVDAYGVHGCWLLMTLGLTELFDKVSDDPDVSGWGFELTMRVPRGDGHEPPAWALNLLMKLAQYVFGTGRPFAPGHRMSPGGPITGTDDTALSALAFAADPELPRITTPHGSVEFLTVVGITADELNRMKQTTTEAVLDDLRIGDPRLLTDPARR